MSSPSPPPPSPPPHPPSLPFRNTHTRPLWLPYKPTIHLPDLIFTALSLLFFSSSSSTPCKFHFFSSPPSINPRRFLRLPTMSLSPQTPPRNHHPFPTPQSLSDWLKPRLPSDSFASWGLNPGTKNVHNLWLELSEGETSLSDSTPPVRTVNVVSIRIIGKDPSRVLVESHQELSNGHVRHRNRPLSEKMKPNETPESAVHRAVKEELGSIMKRDGETVRIVPGSYSTKVEERNSVSYPGLPACYVLHTVDAEVEGLPEEEFCTEEVGEEGEYGDCLQSPLMAADEAVLVKKHFWKWVHPDLVQS